MRNLHRYFANAERRQWDAALTDCIAFEIKHYHLSLKEFSFLFHSSLLVAAFNKYRSTYKRKETALRAAVTATFVAVDSVRINFIPVIDYERTVTLITPSLFVLSKRWLLKESDTFRNRSSKSIAIIPIWVRGTNTCVATVAFAPGRSMFSPLLLVLFCARHASCRISYCKAH